MILDVVVSRELDGYNALVKSVKGCENWAPTEEEALDGLIPVIRFYLNLTDSDLLKYDRARGDATKRIYKLVIEKE